MKSPFKFLDSYIKEDRELFFGREREIEELYHRIFESKILLVYGLSGTGKSSLIHCGLANKFQESDWLPLVIRRGNNILKSMAASIRDVSVTEQQSKFISPEDFKKGVKSLYLDHYKPVFFIFDQFEELFIFGDKDERRAFISVIKSLFESELPCRLIFVMREEYMAGVTEFERFIPTFFSNRVRIEKMSYREALEAIKGPCKVAGIRVEEGFAETLLERLSPGSTDVELTYMQVFLDKVFRLVQEGEHGHQNELSFTLNLLQNLGNVSDLLGSFLDEQIALQDDPEIALTVLKSFVSVKGTKKQLSPEEIAEYARTLGKPIDEKRLLDLLQTLINLRILRDKDQNEKYELRHDALASKIFEKITLVEKEILEVRQFVENSFSNFEKRQIYLSPEDLSYIAPYEDKLFINKKLSDFIENSKRNITAKKRAFYRILRYSALGFLVIIISIFVYYLRTNVKAISEDLSKTAFLQKEFSPSLSFQTALKAYAKDSTSTLAIKALFDSFYSLPDEGPYNDSTGNVIDPVIAFSNFRPCASKIKYARFSEDGTFIYGFLEDKTINVWDRQGKLVFSRNENRNPVTSLKMSPDNEYIAAAFWDSTAIIWNLKGEIIRKSHIVFDPLNPCDVIDFSHDSNVILMLRGENRISIYNLKDSSGYDLEGHRNEVNGAVFSPDGKFIASASKDSTIIIWQYDNNQKVFTKVNTINSLKSVVWSVDFAKNSKYILTLSDCDAKDRGYCIPIRILNLNGDWSDFVYFETDSATLTKYSKSFTGFYYSAQFIADDAAFRISTFSDKSSYIENKNNLPEPRSEGYNYHRINLSGNSLFWLTQTNKYLRRFDNDMKEDENYIKEKHNRGYSFIDVSKKYIALNKEGDNFSTLIAFDGLPILKLKGKQPCFSPDGRYLLCLDGFDIKLYPADEKELINLAVKEEIYKKLENRPKNWMLFH